jgi:hypothetical protein
MSACRAYRFSGPVVDILSRIWSKEAQTLPSLVTTLEASQGPADIEQGIRQLAQSGCISASGDHVELTRQGQQIRDQIEAETDRIFFASWDQLAASDVLWLAEQTSAVSASFRALAH